MAHSDGDVKQVNRTEDEVREPGMFHVILLNDNYTPMDFVVEVLLKVFGKSENSAIQLMMRVHEEGEAIAATYVEDIARSKSELVRKVAKDNGFPLKTKVQPA
jgi:ATP-dependent Clp protease adaptor protein ClpS